MNTKALSLCLSLSLLSAHSHGQPSPASGKEPARQPQVILFDADWKFHRGRAPFAEQPGFDDAAWRTLDLPHDWSIEDAPGTASPFNRDAVGQVSAGFTIGG